MRGNSGRKCSSMVVMSLRSGTKGALRVKLSHPYIGVRVNNCLWDIRRVIRDWLEDMCMVLDARVRALMWYGALKPACSFRQRALVWWMFSPRVNIGLTFLTDPEHILLR
jgi:hypothetical protein